MWKQIRILLRFKKGVLHTELNKIYNEDCITYMKQTVDNSFDLTLTDIPYGEVNRESNGLRAGGVSAVAYARYVWEKGFNGDTIVKWFN